MPHPYKILVATDFSDGANAALDVAHEIATACGASIDLVHAWQAPGFLPPGVSVGVPDGGHQTLVGLIEDNSDRELKVFSEQAKARGIEIGKLYSEEGDPAHAVVEVARREGHDMIAVGTAGRTGLMHVLLGSVAEKIVRLSHTPVLTVRTPED